MSRTAGRLTLALLCRSALAISALAQPPTENKLWKQLVQQSYAEHNRIIARSLPPNSSPPPSLDLTGRKFVGRICDSGPHTAWEEYFHGILSNAPMQDLGVNSPFESTSLQLTVKEVESRIHALPAKFSPVVVTARTLSQHVCVPESHTYVYTRFDVQISERLKPLKIALSETVPIVAAQFGGSILFPSGQLTTFLLDKRGFLGLDKDYVLFLWKPLRSDDTYVVSQAYLIQDGLVYPISTSAERETLYENAAPGFLIQSEGGHRKEHRYRLAATTLAGPVTLSLTTLGRLMILYSAKAQLPLIAPVSTAWDFGVDKGYVLFFWKLARSDEKYRISQAYFTRRFVLLGNRIEVPRQPFCKDASRKVLNQTKSRQQVIAESA